MNHFKIGLITSFMFLSLQLFAQDEKPAQDENKKPDTEKPERPEKNGERPGRGERPGGGQRPGGGRGNFTPEMWRQFSERMPKIGQVSGIVVDDATGKPIEYATVSLLLSLDSSVVDGTITGADGKFLMEELPMGPFIVSAEFMGYGSVSSEKFRINPRKQTAFDLGELRMSVEAEQLGEVVVEEKRPFVEMELDKKIYNVSDNLTVSGGTATEVLETLPSIEVDIDGNVSLRGSSNLTVLVDGRQSNLSGLGMDAVLEQIPADAIDRVEVITNPSAKFDPDGMAGIINIILKKNKKIGLNGFVSANYTPIDRFGGSGSLSYRNKKVNVYTNYSYNRSERNFNRETERRGYFDAAVPLTDGSDFIYRSFIQEGSSSRKRRTHLGKIGIDFSPEPNSTIFTSYSIGFGNRPDESSLETSYFDALGAKTADALFEENEEDPGLNHDVVLGYQKRFGGKWDHQLNIDLNYSTRSSEEETSIIRTYTATGDFDDPIADPDNQFDMSDRNNSTISAALDYDRPFEDGAKLETGYKTIVTENDRNYNSTIFDYSTGTYVNNVGLSNHFKFQQQVHAVYATYGRPITETFSVKAGIRLEQAIVNSELLTTGETFNKRYFSYFPSAAMTQKFPDESEIQLSYSRRINRPRSRQINPFPSQTDPFNIRQGNPDLDPEYTNNLELSYMKRWDKLTLTPSIFYRYVTGVMRRYRTIDGEGVSTLNYVNFDNARNFGVELAAVYTPTKWWRLMPSVEMYQSIVDGGDLDSEINNNTFSLGGRVVSSMTVWKDLDIQVFLMMRAPAETAQGRRKGMIFSNIGLKKKILDGKGTVGLSARSLFGLTRFSYITDTEDLYQTFTGQMEPNLLNFSFSYRFGKQERQQRRRGGRDGFNQGGGMDDMME